MDIILILNVGSSSLKFSVFSIKDRNLNNEYSGSIDSIQDLPHLKIKKGSLIEVEQDINVSKDDYYKDVLYYLLKWLKTKGLHLVAAGHRIVHGGDFSSAVVIDKKVLDKLEKLIPFSPLHQPYNLKGVYLLEEVFPNLFQTASFDSAFHSTCNPISQSYALPKSLTELGIRRYGFHGLSYEYIASQLPVYLSEKTAMGKVIIAHLGSGSTMCAMEGLKSVATSIGMTSMGGLPMATRSGDVDPYLAVYLAQLGWSPERIQKLYYKDSGLLGVSGISGDMKVLLSSDKKEAKLAVDIFVHRVMLFTGSLAAELQGVDALIFTGGIGTHAAPIREKVCKKIAWLNIDLDREKNNRCKGDALEISNEKSKVKVWVIPTDEEIVIAKHALELYLKR